MEEVGLQPIAETDEIVEEEEDVIEEQEDEEAIAETKDAEGVAFGALVDSDKGMTTCSFYVFNFDAFNLTRIYIPRR